MEEMQPPFSEETELEIDSLDLGLDIDTEKMETDAFEYASALISNLTSVYSDKELLASQPNLKKTIDTELDSLSNLIQLRNTQMLIHKQLVNGINKQPDNAALYNHLGKIPQNVIKLQDKIDSVVDRLKITLKNIQLQLPFKENTEQEKPSAAVKGSKDFITALRAQQNI